MSTNVIVNPEGKQSASATVQPTQSTSVSMNPPTNAQISGAMEKTKSALQQQQSANVQIDQTGKQLASGAEKLVSSAQEMLLSANEDEKIQNFIQHLGSVSEKMKQQQQKVSNSQQTSEDAHKVKDNFQQMATQLRDLVRDLITSSELRGLLVDLIDTFDKLFSAFSSKVNIKDKLKHSILATDSSAEGKQQLQQHGKDLQHEIKEGADSSSKQLSDQEKEELIRKFRMVLTKLGSHPAYKKSLESFMYLYDLIRSKQDNVDESLKQETRQLYQEASEILRGFIQNKDLHPLEDKSRQFYAYLDEHHDINQFFQEFRKWTDDLINRPDSVPDSEVLERGKYFINRGNEIFQDGTLREILNEISNELKDILHRFQTDPRTLKMREGVSELQQAFAGSPLRAISQTRQLAIPILKEFLKEIPLPKVEGTTDNGSTYSLDNMVLRGKEISLDDINVKFNFGLNDMITLVFKIKNIEANIRNIHFTYNSKGLFKYEDEGTISCFMSSPGWKLKWVVREVPNQPLRFEFTHSQTDIRKLKITIEEAKHKMLDKMITSLFSGLIKRRVQTSAEESLQKQGNQITSKVNESFAQLQGKVSSAAASAEQAASTGSHHTSASATAPHHTSASGAAPHPSVPITH